MIRKSSSFFWFLPLCLILGAFFGSSSVRAALANKLAVVGKAAFNLRATALSSPTPPDTCLTETTQADFQTGTSSNLDLTTSPGDVTLTNAPTIDQQNTAGTTTGTGFGTPAWTGMTFIPAVTGTLVKADIELFCSGCGATPPNLTLSVRNTSAGLPTGADLATVTIPGSAFSSGATVLYTASFGSPATLTAGTQYALILRPVSAPAGSGYFWIRSSPSTYANGSRVLSANSGSTWSADTTRDYNFKTYMQTGYTASGDLVSSLKDASPAPGTTTHWTTLSWNATTPANTSLKFQAAASNSASGPFNFVGPDGTAATFFTTTGASLSQFNGLRYLKYKAYLSTTDNTQTPTLNDVTVCYDNNNNPTITAGSSLSRSQGTSPSNATIATVNDTETAAGSLTVTATTLPTGITVSNIVNSSGTITADVAADCTAATGDNTIVLTVTDGGNDTATANLTVNVTPDIVSLGNYSNTSVTAGGNTTATPSAAPGGALSAVAATSTDFKGTLTVNPTTGVVSIINARPAGSYTITVKASGPCGSNTSQTFTLTVNNPAVCSTVSFGAKTDFITASNPYMVAVGDFNGDGKQDLVTANGNSDVSILLGDGNGGFSSNTEFVTGTTSISVAVGDFNGDGKQDLATANSDSNNVSILLGDGTGNFGTATNFNVGNAPFSVAVGDFNGDGKQDLAVTNQNDGNVSILLGDGIGSFGSPTNFAVTGPSYFVVVGDFNSDDKQDLAVTTSTNQVSILLGNGSGSFGAATNYNVGDTPVSIAVGDFNGDSKQDLAVGNFYSHNVSILLGNGSGGFGAATNFSAGNEPGSVDVGDFNGDGKLDLVTSDRVNGTMSILLGDGSGSFGSPTSFSMGVDVNAVVVGDFNGDGRQDVATANQGSDSVSVRLSDCTSNSAPTISDITDQTINEDTALSALSFTVGDDQTAVGSLNVTGSSSNQALVPDANIVFGGSGANRTVTVTPAANQSGTTMITIDVSDGSLTTSETFTLTVDAVNDPPALTVPGAQSATVLSNLTLSGISVADVDVGSGNLQVTLSAARGTLSLSQTTGLGFTTGNGSQNSSMVFTGTLANINAALNNLVYRGTDASTGGDTINLAVNDQGNTGGGGSQSDSKTIAVTLSKVSLTVTADNQSKSYGAANPTFTHTYSGFADGQVLATSGVTGTPTLTTTADDSSGVGSYTITTGVGTLASANYSFNLVNGTLSVTPATLTVTADGQVKVYGDANPTLTASYTGFVNNETASVLSGAPDLTTTATASSNAGTYPITITAGTLSATNYTFNLVNGTLAVGKAVLTVTADQKTKLYGATNPTLTVSYTGFVNNDTASVLTGAVELTTTATDNSPVGVYGISTAVGTLSAANYTFSLVNSSLTVTTVALTVTAENKSKTYGDANPTLTFTYSGFINGDDASVLTGAPTVGTTATASSNVGAHPITVTQGTLEATNYAFVFVNGTLTINKAALTATASNASRGYGAANPNFTGNLAGIQNNDNITASYTTAATAGSPAGTYAITPVVADPDSKLGNYQVTLNNSTLTVAPVALTVTADHKTKVYGAANPALTVSYTGFVNNDTASALGGTLSLNTTATPNSTPGNYPITVSGLTSLNYIITFVNGELTVSKATITVTADNNSKVYGAANPTLTYTYSGFIGNDTASVVSGEPSLTSSATDSTGVGNYTITPSAGNLSAANYNFNFVNGTLNITPATLTVTANNAARLYGAANPAFTAAYSGFVGNDTASVLNGEPSLTTSATPASGVGSYPITAAAGNLSAANYTFTFASGALTVNKATLTVTADNQTKLYGAANPTLTASYTGFVGNDTVNALSGAPSLNTTATTNSVIGNYPITVNAGTLSAANYDFTFVDGTLTVGKAATTTVLASSLASASYGQPLTLTATVSRNLNPPAGNKQLLGINISAPTGMVQFFDGATLLGTAALSNGSASLPIGLLAAANHSLTAVYSGDEQYEGSTSATTMQTVNKADAGLTITSSANPAVWKQYLTFTATISGVQGAAAPTGLVAFKDGATVLGTFTLDSLGRATLRTSNLTAGSHTLTAEYSGNTNYLAAASSELTQSVSKGLSTTTLTSSANPSSIGQPVTLTATVLGTGGTPTGSVEFFAGEVSLGTALLNGKTATLTANTLSDAMNSLTAVYTGDDQFAASTSPVLKQAVLFFCTFTLSRLNQTFELAGGTGEIQVTTRSDCDWTVISQANWITVTGNSVRNGEGTVNFTVAPLTSGQARTGTITIAGQTVTITQAKPIAVVSAASYEGLEVAPGAIVTIFGVNLSSGTETVSSLPLPTTLAGTMIKVTDSQGVTRFSPLFYVSPSQINFLIPADTALGAATLAVVNGAEEVTGAGVIQIAMVSPGLFTANSNGQDVAAAVLFRLSGDGTQSYEFISQFDAGQNKHVPTPIDLGPDTDQVFLLLFGTGLRNRTSLVGVTAHIGNEEVEVLYAGAQGGFEGLDQVNLSIPRSLIGVGETTLVLTVDGKVVNTVRINIR